MCYQQALSVQSCAVLGDMLKATARVSVCQGMMQNNLRQSAWPSIGAPPGLELPGKKAISSKERGYSSYGESKHKEKPKRGTGGLLIGTVLNELNNEDPCKMIIVRKINRLGFGSASILKQYFGQFGIVEQVRLSNSHKKPEWSSGSFRLRPSGIAFLVFADAQSASNAVAAGKSQVVAGAEIFVTEFVSRTELSKDPSDDERRSRCSSTTTAGSMQSTSCSDDENYAESS